MQNSDWIALLELFPPEQQNKLCVTTRTGTELAIDTIIRTEPQLLVFRGRVVGQTDEGRAFFLPYSEITFININRLVSEQEIHTMFGDPPDDGRIEAAADDYGEESAILPPPPVPASPPPGKGSGLVPTIPATLPLKAPAPATKSPPAVAESPAAKGSILERLRAQRKNAPGK